MGEMIVYRIEDAAGRGPYRRQSKNKDGVVWWQEKDHNASCPRTPTLSHEAWFSDKEMTVQVDARHVRASLPNSTFFFGFVSMQSLLNWFDPVELWLLKESGYSIKEYDCEVVFFGSKQCIFKKCSGFF
jgi:hypothetical protein